MHSDSNTPNGRSQLNGFRHRSLENGHVRGLENRKSRTTEDVFEPISGGEDESPEIEAPSLPALGVFFQICPNCKQFTVARARYDTRYDLLRCDRDLCGWEQKVLRNTISPIPSTNGELTLADFGELLSEIQEEPVKWLANHRLAESKIHLTIGPGGVGKSTYSLAKMAALSIGGFYPGGPRFSKSGKIAILAVEDGKKDTIKPRFVAAGGDPEKVLVLRTRITKKDKQGRDVILHAVFKDLDYWRKLFDIWQPIGLLADPVQAFMGRGVNDSRNAEVRDILEPFAELIREYGVFLEAITHTPKKIESANAAEMAISSVAYPNVSRVVHVHWNDPDLEDHYIVTQAKNSVGKRQPPIGYTIQEHRYELDGEVFLPSKIVPDETAPEITERELLSRTGKVAKVASRGKNAVAWLEERFSEQKIWPSEELKVAAKAAGISKDALWSQQVKELPIKKEKVGTNWYWHAIPPWPDE